MVNIDIMNNLVKKSIDGKFRNLSDVFAYNKMMIDIYMTINKNDPEYIFTNKEYYNSTKDFENYKGLIYNKFEINDFDVYYNSYSGKAIRSEDLIKNKELNDPYFKAMILIASNIFIPSLSTNMYNYTGRYGEKPELTIEFIKNVVNDDDIDKDTMDSIMKLLLFLDMGVNDARIHPEEMDTYNICFLYKNMLRDNTDRIRNAARINGFIPSIYLDRISEYKVKTVFSVLSEYRKSNKFNPEIEKLCLKYNTLDSIANNKDAIARYIRNKTSYYRADYNNMISILSCIGDIHTVIINCANEIEEFRDDLLEYDIKIMTNFINCINESLSTIFSTTTMGALRRAGKISFTDNEIKGFELINEYQDLINQSKLRKSMTKYYVDHIL